MTLVNEILFLHFFSLMLANSKKLLYVRKTIEEKKTCRFLLGQVMGWVTLGVFLYLILDTKLMKHGNMFSWQILLVSTWSYGNQFNEFEITSRWIGCIFHIKVQEIGGTSPSQNELASRAAYIEQFIQKNEKETETCYLAKEETCT